jgi:hypothetical protein
MRRSGSSQGISGIAGGVLPASETICSHPLALFFLFFFRTLAIATYLLCGFFSNSYVLSVSKPFFVDAGLGV